MDYNNLLPVPLMRECLTKEYRQHSSAGTVGAAIAFVICVITGFTLSLLLQSKIVFLILLIIGAIIATIVYIMLPRLGKTLSPKINDRILQIYSPFIAKLNTAGFEAAAENTKAIIKLSIVVSQNNPNIFTVIDDSLRFFLLQLVNISNAKTLIGDSSDLKRQFSRLQSSLDSHLRQTQSGFVSKAEKEDLHSQISAIQMRLDKIELLNKAAVQLSQELLKLRTDCETVVVEKLTSKDESQKSALLLKEQLDRERRIASELQSLGLM